MGTFYLKDKISYYSEKYWEEISWYLKRNPGDIDGAAEELEWKLNLTWYEAQWIVEEINDAL